MNLEAVIELDAWTSVRPGNLPCAGCGLAVRCPAENYGADHVELLQVFGLPRTNRPAPLKNFAVTRCSTCRALRQVALDLLAAHPSVRARIGSADIAAHRLEAALGALDLLNINDPTRIDSLTANASDLYRLMDALTIGGGTARWASQARDAGLSRAASTPASGSRWAHVAPDQRQQLRNAAATLLADRIEKPVDVLCISYNGEPAGCMLCGIGAVKALRKDAESAWTLMSADSASIGGPGRADSLDGVVCPRCDAAIDRAHGVGISAMTLSVRSFLGVPPHLRSLETIDGLIGWAALSTGTAPNREPWDHIDLAELRDAAATLVGRSMS